MRSSIFNIIESIRLKQGLSAGLDGLKVLDLFAGSGALGWEALSRGAESAVFLEKSRDHARTIAQNAAEFSCEDRVKILSLPFERAEKALLAEAPFGLIFADPPYDYADLEGVPQLVAHLGALGAIFVMEHAPGTSVNAPQGFAEHSRRELGPALISIFTHSGSAAMLE